MMLTELEPMWLTLEDRRVGFIFRCPLPARRATEWQTCFFETFPVSGGRDEAPFNPRSQLGIVKSSGWQGDLHHIQFCKKDCAWTCTPPARRARFGGISVTPSLDGSQGGNWHGFITNGQIVGGL